MIEGEKSISSCPKCGSPMLEGSLTVTVDPVQVVATHSLMESALEALICSVCGYVELWARDLENLTREDFSDEELADL